MTRGVLQSRQRILGERNISDLSGGLFKPRSYPIPLQYHLRYTICNTMIVIFLGHEIVHRVVCFHFFSQKSPCLGEAADEKRLRNI